MKRAKVLLIIVFSPVILCSQNSIKFTKSKPNICEDKVKVVDIKPISCDIDNVSVLFPVIDEEFNFKEDLPNNWGFNMEYTYDNDYDLKGKHFIWSGPDLEAYYNNTSVSNGICFLTVKKEQRNNKFPSSSATYTTNYEFTVADLRSLFTVQGGVFKCSMKLPENNLLWPAYWLRGSVAEIDVFEFYDGNVAQSMVCDVYHSMRMTAGNLVGTTQCSRGRKFTVEQDFFNTSHSYQLKWSDYRYDIHLDNSLVGYATKYYDSPWFSPGGCQTGDAFPLVPVNTYYCQQLNDLQNCKVSNPINNNCVVYNKIWKDQGFINSNTNMNLFISMSMFGEANNWKLFNSWNNYSDVNKRIEIDRLTVWQPVNCSINRLICSKQDFTVATGGSSFLSGAKITIKACNTTNFSVFPGSEVTNKENYHVLASEEIELLDEIFINEGTFFKADIIDCNSGSNIGAIQRSNNGSPSFVTVDEGLLNEIEKRELDSLVKSGNLIYDDDYFSNAHIKSSSENDNGSISIYPNPTSDYLLVDMHEEDFNDIQYMELIDVLGIKTRIEKTSRIDVKELRQGLYQLKFVFSFGYIVVKSFLKTE
jgi:hypothetical protein